MRKVDKPVYSARETFQKCFSNIERPVGLKERFANITEIIELSSTEYEEKAVLSTLHTILPSDRVGSEVTVKDMERLYSDKLAHKNGPARYIYDQIKSKPRHGICPLCGVNNIETLDHVLAKSTHATLTVSPVNLVPSCRYCNDSSKQKFPTSQNEQLIHPYFDDVDSIDWLECKLKADDSDPDLPFLAFFYAQPKTENLILKSRILNHFKELKLAALYGFKAAEELSIRSQRLNRLSIKGKEEVRDYLFEEASTAANHWRNSWRAVLLRTAAEDDWFCETGVKLIRTSVLQ